MPVVGYSLSLTVAYNANGGYGAPSSTTKTITVAELPYTVTITVSSTVPWRVGYHFLSWGGYSTGSTYSYTFNEVAGKTSYSASKTLSAVWEKNVYYVTYKPGSYGTGNQVSDQKTHGVNITLRGAIYTRNDYVQVGWSSTDGGAQLYSLGATYTKDEPITLYPVWAKLTFAYVKVSGTWKDATVYVKVGGVWKEVSAAYVKVGGTWKPT